MNTAVAELDLVESGQFDPFGLDFRDDPRRFHAALFAGSPGFMEMEGVPSAFVATYAQCAAVMRDFKRFSSLKPKGLPGMQRIDFFNSLPVMNYSDPPHHTRRRKVVNPAFTPKRVELLLEQAGKVTDRLLDAAVANGRFDVMADLGMPLSSDTLLTRFLQIDPADQPMFIDFVKTLPLLDALKLNDPKPQPYLDAWQAGVAYCRRQKELAESGAADTLIGQIISSAEGGAISDDEMMAMMIVLLTGGVSTVAGAIGISLLNLARSPEARLAIAADPSLALNLVDESLRLDPPVSLVMRFAMEDVEIGGKTISKGMPVYVMIATACRDPEVFPDPYRFDIHRANWRDHLAFGYGIHTCIGNAITRSLVPMVVRKVVERMPNLALADGDGHLEWEASTPRARHLRRLDLDVG